MRGPRALIASTPVASSPHGLPWMSGERQPSTLPPLCDDANASLIPQIGCLVAVSYPRAANARECLAAQPHIDHVDARAVWLDVARDHHVFIITLLRSSCCIPLVMRQSLWLLKAVGHGACRVNVCVSLRVTSSC
jgi:hypothetical protein